MLLRPIRMLLVYDAVKTSCCPHFFYNQKKKKIEVKRGGDQSGFSTWT